MGAGERGRPRHAAGNAYHYLALVDLPLDQVPYPSFADAAWLGRYPVLAAAPLLLVRALMRAAPRVMWLDGVIAGYGAAAVAGALAVDVRARRRS